MSFFTHKTCLKILLITSLFLSILFKHYSLFSQQNYLRFQHLTVEDGLSQNTIQGIVQDKYGFMWFGTWSGLCKYDGYKFTVYQHEHGKLNSIPDNRIHLLYKDVNGDVWVSFSYTYLISRYNYETDDFTSISRELNPVLADSLLRSKRKSNYCATNPEYNWQILSINRLLFQTNRKTGDQITYKTDPLNPLALNDEFVNDIYLDNNDVLWVGTSNIGINKADTKQKKFNHYDKKDHNGSGLIDNIIRTICEDKEGNLWIGTRNKGITKFDRKNNIYTHYQNNSKDSLHSLISNNVRKIYCDSYGLVWIGTKEGLSCLNPKTNRFNSYTPKTKSKIPHEWVYAITEDHNHNLWIGTSLGILKFERKNNKFITYDITVTAPAKSIRAIFEDKKHNLWVGTEGKGIFKIKHTPINDLDEKLSATHYVNIPSDSNSLSNDGVFTMIEDEKGIIWIGTNNGLNRFDPDKNKFTRFAKKDGLPHIFIMGLLSDGNGHIWISHKKGLTKLDTKTYAMKNYTEQEGLQSNEFSEDAYFRSIKTGEMFFGGVHGFNSFFPDSIKDNPYSPQKVFFTDLKILNTSVKIKDSYNGNVILTQPLYLTDGITLTEKDKSVAIEFAALHYSNPKGNKYAYMLEGFDKDWIYTDASNRVASYSNLDPNTYVLKVKASNSDGIWTATPATLKIIVLPPIWRTSSAYVVYFLILALIFFLIYKYIVWREKLKNQVSYERMRAEKIDEVNQIKLQFFTSISHEFRTPLSLIIDPLEKLTNENIPQFQARQYYKIMTRNAKRLLKLVNQLLEFRKSERGHLKLEAIQEDIVQFIKPIADTFFLHAAQRNIHLSFELPKNALWVWFDPDKLDIILYNLISNAFKYTPNFGEITINVAQKNLPPDKVGITDCVEISIKDNGIGIDEDTLEKIFEVFYRVEGNEMYEGEGTGIGLALAKELVKLHKGEIIVKSEKNQGSCFSVLLPLGDKHLDKKEKSERKDSYEIDSKTTFTQGINQKPEIQDSQNGTYQINGNGFRNQEILQAESDSSDYSDENANKKIDSENDERTLILLIEDNADVRNYLKHELKEYYQIIDASNGVEGFEKALELNPTLIISDIMMPKMDGIELCKKLKTDERTSHIPVILLTARQSSEYIIEGYETGADAYITKPFSSSVLYARIKNLIESRCKLRERFGKSIIFDPKKYEINITDEAFINRARNIVEENISIPGFDSETFADKLKMSRTLVYQKIKALTNQTVHDFITTIKLNKAAELLLAGKLSIAEVAYKVGYTQPTNFRRSFIKQFGESPKNYILRIKELKN